jgi:pimeloyl-ACP methyl ester carboxylesterase
MVCPQPRRRALTTDVTARRKSHRRDDMTTLTFIRSGAGAPLVLLHGIGSSRQAWDPVIPALAEHFDVLAVDLPGRRARAP